MGIADKKSAPMPQVMENAAASTGATTEAMPFTPQAQGTSAGALSFSRSNATGTKVPSRVPSGATSANTMSTRVGNGRVTQERSDGNRKAYSTSIRPASRYTTKRNPPSALVILEE